jgi:hypothetical protein
MYWGVPWTLVVDRKVLAGSCALNHPSDKIHGLDGSVSCLFSSQCCRVLGTSTIYLVASAKDCAVIRRLQTAHIIFKASVTAHRAAATWCPKSCSSRFRSCIQKPYHRVSLAYFDPADAEVCYFRTAIDVKQDVLRFEIPVHHTRVQVCQALRHIVCNLHML